MICHADYAALLSPCRYCRCHAYTAERFVATYANMLDNARDTLLARAARRRFRPYVAADFTAAALICFDAIRHFRHTPPP